MTDPANPGQPYGGQPYGGQPDQPGQYGQPGHYGGQPGESYGGQGAYGPPPGSPPPPPPGSPYSGYSGEAPAPYPGGPVPGGPVPPPAKKSGGKVVGIIIGAVVLLLVVCVGGGALLWNNVKENPTNAKVGDCLAGETMDSTTAREVHDIKKVDCTATNAKYKVAGIVENKTEIQFKIDNEICHAFPTAESALWQGTQGKPGSVLCLEPIKK